MRVVGREDFISMKCFAGGPQDLADARDAFLGARGPADLDLLRTVTGRFGRDAAAGIENVLGAKAYCSGVEQDFRQRRRRHIRPQANLRTQEILQFLVQLRSRPLEAV